MGQRSSTLSTEEIRLADSWRLKFTRSGCAEESAPCSVLVIGEAGSGKSTLVNNLVRYEDSHTEESGSRQSSAHAAGAGRPVYAVELNEYHLEEDSGRGRNEMLPQRITYHERPSRGGVREDEDFLRFVEEDRLRSQYIWSIESILQKRKIDLIILCLKMPVPRSELEFPNKLHTSAAFGRIVRKAKRTIVALTFADCCSAGLGVVYGPSAQVSHFNRELDEWKHTVHQWASMSQKLAKNVLVYPICNDPRMLLPNQEKWLPPLVLGIREMLSPEAVKYLIQKQHAALCRSTEKVPKLGYLSQSTESATSVERETPTNSRKTATSADGQQNQTPTGSGCKASILSQKVYDREDHLMLLREHVSRKAAGKGRAVLEVLLCDASTIEACFTNNPRDEEDAVQAGVVKWIGGTGKQPTTWETILYAMNFARIAQQHIQSLKEDLGIPQAMDVQTGPTSGDERSHYT